MPSQAIEFKSPTKGVNKDVPYSEFPPDFALDSLNVLPFDTDSRRRPTQRPGTSKVYASALGSGAPVRALVQATIPLDTSVATATNTAVNETFTYADGAINTVTGGIWAAYYGTVSAGGVALAASTAPVISSNAVSFGIDASATSTTIRLVNTPDVGSVYTVKFDAVGLSAVGGVGAHTIFCCTRWGFNQTSPEDAVCLKIARDVISLGKSGTTYTSLTPGGTPFAGTHSWEVRVAGNSYSVYMDGVLKLGPTTITDYSTRSGFGMAGSRGDGSNGSPSIDNYQILYGNASVHFRQVNVVSVSAGNVYMGDTATTTLVTSGTAALDSTVTPGVAWSGTKMYFVDGQSTIKMLNLSTRAMATFTATAGTYPTGCRIACMYRDRLVLAGQDATPHIWYMSRSGTQTDWDYTQTDSAAAVVGSGTVAAGKIGEPIVALIPGGDDVLYLCGDHNIWAMNGDPADGGSIDLLTDGVGIAGMNAWTKAPDGTIYFVGNGGLYTLSKSGVANVSDGKWTDYFRDVNRGTSYVTVAWDRDRNGCYVFVTPAVPTTAPTHLFFDATGGGLWPVKYPLTFGPYSVLVYDGDAPDDRAIYFGTSNGYVEQMDLAATSDDGTAISSYLYLGPIKANEVTGSVMEWLDLMVGESSSTAVTATVQTGTTVEGAINSPRVTRSRSFTGARRMTRWLQRVGGVYFLLKLANSTLDKTWSYEKAVAQMLVAGDVRRR